MKRRLILTAFILLYELFTSNAIAGICELSNGEDLKPGPDPLAEYLRCISMSGNYKANIDLKLAKYFSGRWSSECENMQWFYLYYIDPFGVLHMIEENKNSGSGKFGIKGIHDYVEMRSYKIQFEIGNFILANKVLMPAHAGVTEIINIIDRDHFLLNYSASLLPGHPTGDIELSISSGRYVDKKFGNKPSQIITRCGNAKSNKLSPTTSYK